MKTVMVNVGMSPRAITRIGWLTAVNHLLEQPECYRSLDGRHIDTLFPPRVVEKLESKLEEQGVVDVSDCEVRWSIRYLEDIDVIYFRLMVDVPNKEQKAA